MLSRRNGAEADYKFSVTQNTLVSLMGVFRSKQECQEFIFPNYLRNLRLHEVHFLLTKEAPNCLV